MADASVQKTTRMVAMARKPTGGIEIVRFTTSHDSASAWVMLERVLTKHGWELMRLGVPAEEREIKAL